MMKNYLPSYQIYFVKTVFIPFLIENMHIQSWMVLFYLILGLILL